MSPTLNRSTALQHFECGNAIEMRNGLMFDFYPGLPHVFNSYLCRACHTFTVQCKDATYSLVPRLIAHRQPGYEARMLHALTAEVYTMIYLHCLPRFQLILMQSLKYFIFIPTQSSARMLLIALYPGSLPTNSLGLVLHALTAVHYDLPSLSSNGHQALIPSNTSRSIKIPPGIRSHLLQLWPVIMDKSNILWFLKIYTISPSSYIGNLYSPKWWASSRISCMPCMYTKAVCISVINCFCILLRLCTVSLLL